MVTYRLRCASPSWSCSMIWARATSTDTLRYIFCVYYRTGHMQKNTLIHVCLATKYNFLSWNSQALRIVFWSPNFLKKKASSPGHLHACYTGGIMIKWAILRRFLVVIMMCHLMNNIAKTLFLCDSKRQTQNCIHFPKRILIKLLTEELYSSWQIGIQNCIR